MDGLHARKGRGVRRCFGLEVFWVQRMGGFESGIVVVLQRVVETAG